MRIYDTLRGRKEEFVSTGSEVKMYVCGVTPYDVSHVGHAMSYVVFDVIRRYLEHKGYQVRHVQNFTDIDDKLIQRANQQGISVEELARRNIDAYFNDMDTLNIRRAHVYPMATQEIPRIIEVISVLMTKGYAYAANGDVYFRVGSAQGYGKLSGRNLEGMMAGSRVEVSAQKENPMDFALWKGAKPGEPSWDSPWGPGRPGWHIECTAMSLEYLGETLDIHGGGQDLVFPHHENEVAQSEAYTGVTPFVRFWVHNGLLQLDDDKMSKSLGNLVTVQEVLGRYSVDALRLFFLSSNYRSPLTYTDGAVGAMERAMDRLRHALRDAPSLEGAQTFDVQPYRQRFIEAMDDDFNTPQALAVIFDLAREINRGREEGLRIEEAQEGLRELAEVFGLTFRELEGSWSRSASPFVEMLLETRAELRAAEQWALADRIRTRLAELGILLEDTPQGTQWKHRSSST